MASNQKIKILHTADWHLGKKLDHISRLPEQRAVLAEICDIADQEAVDVVLVAGDLFDTFNPPSEAEELLYKTLKRLSQDGKRVVIAIAGNHDSPERIEAPDPLARECGIIFAGYPHSEIPTFELPTGLKVLQSAPGFLELYVPTVSFPLRLLLTPYANEFRLRKYLGTEDQEEALRKVLENSWKATADNYCDDKGVNILVSHLFFTADGKGKMEEPEEEKPILHVGGAQAIFAENVPKQLQYVALGHLHRRQEISISPCPIRYAGSPLSYSFAEANQKKSVTILSLEPGQDAEIEKITLKEGRILCRKHFEDIEAAAQWLAEHPTSIAEISLQLDTYLSVADKNRLQSINPDIFLIPVLRQDAAATESQQKQIDLTKSRIELFQEFFEHKKGLPPEKAIVDLFKEVLAEEGE